MKINILLYHLDQGGVEKTAVDFANELVELGNSVTITTIYKHNPKLFRIDKKVRLVNLMGFYFKGLDRIVKAIPARILSHFFLKKEFDIEIAFQADLPTKMINESKFKNSIKYAWIHGIGFENLDSHKNFNEVFFVGQDLKSHYESINSMYKNHKYSVFYNNMNFDEIKLLAQSEKIQLPGKVNLVTIGRLSYEKQFDILIRKFSEMSRDKGVYHLSILGDGVLSNELNQLIKDLKMENNVSLLGYKENPYPYLKSADVYICSSLYEGFNVSMTEAAMLKIPVISTNVNGANELLNSEPKSGLIIDFDLNDLGEKIDYCVNNSSISSLKLLNYNKITKIYETRRILMIDKFGQSNNLRGGYKYE